MLNPQNPVFARWVLFGHSYLLYVKAVERALAPFDLSLSQFLTLWILNGASGPVTPSIVASFLTQEPHSVTSLLQRMEARGLIRRTRNESDGRSSILHATTKGAETLSSCADGVFSEITNFFSPLPEELQEEFEDSLRRLRDYTAERLDIDVSRLDRATRQVERDPDMWTPGTTIRDFFPSGS